ncbi:MAG: 4-hydroxy-tetrahydrodipicolinate reductase [Candidatus Sumerlaeota bacterium]|nr:4-hydroxy-tetrahydrodipicolinate reductase [Candidatus Sumerlaeota bacterium]
MNLALFGYGRMGREVERAAAPAGHRIVATFDAKAPDAMFREATVERLAEADVCVDFSAAAAVAANLKIACQARKAMVIGTTGWDKDLEEAKRIVAEAGTGMIHAPNFAIGVQTVFRVAGQCARLLDALVECDASILETHHRGKADSPSGTAKRLARILLENLRRKDTIVTEAPQRAMAPNEIHLVSQRLGAVPGTHVVSFDLGDEVIEIRHEARNRAIFARGAIKAAEWIAGKKGVHDFSELFAG